MIDGRAAIPAESPPTGELSALRERYLDLLEGALTHTLYEGADSVEFTPSGLIRRRLAGMLRRRGFVQMSRRADLEDRRAEGRDWPLYAQTMVGLKRLRSLRACVETLLAEEVPGDLIETGVWRGGASIYMRGVLEAHEAWGRSVVVADSFQGLPVADADRYPADAGTPWHTAEHLAISLEEVRENFRRYGLLDRVEFLPGWFKDTLPDVADRTWSLIRLDGDMYESTMDALTNLYPGVSAGGFVIVDDYSIESCREAVQDYRREHGIDAPLTEIDWSGVFWRAVGS